MAKSSGFETAAVAAALLLAACSGAQPRRGAGEGDLDALADRYFDEVVFKYSPTRATRAGLHQYDTRLEDPSRSAIDAQVAALKEFERLFEGLQVLKLREDYRKKAGADFRLQDFHDRFLRQGFPPVKMIRRAMLGDDSPTL